MRSVSHFAGTWPDLQAARAHRDRVPGLHDARSTSLCDGAAHHHSSSQWDLEGFSAGMQDQTLASVADALREPWPGTESRIMSPELVEYCLRWPLGSPDRRVAGRTLGGNSRLDALSAPCSFWAKGRLRRPPRPTFEVASCDLKRTHSSGLNWKTKSIGNRSRLRFICSFSLLVSTPYSAARSESKMTSIPRISRILLSTYSTGINSPIASSCEGAHSSPPGS
jgi:hypothetical protein